MLSQVTFTGDSSRVNRQIVPIISRNTTEFPEYFTVSLDEVALLTSNNYSSLHLSDQERARLVLNPSVANITIVDINGTYK